MTGMIVEPPRRTPIIHQADVCILGGSCTGLFAAVRAARLGASVVLVEKQATHVSDTPQPSTTCAKFGHWENPDGAALGKLVAENREAFGLPKGFVWGCRIPSSALYMIAGTRIAGRPKTFSRWREETVDSPTFYQVPYRALLPREGPGNLIAAGRMIDAEPGAHGAIRVMVNMNQTGEAAGVAAVLSLRHETSFADVPPALLRGTLADGGSIIL